MSIKERLKCVKIGEDTVTVPDPSWRAFDGTNSKTNKIDTVIAVPLGGADTMLYRWSGKKERWSKWRETSHLVSAANIASAGKLADVTEVKTVTKAVTGSTKKSGGNAMNLKKVFGRFGKAAKGDFAISMHGNVAIKRKDGSYACMADGTLQNVEDFAVGVDAFFYLPVTPAELAVNDVVVVGSGVGFVHELVDDGTVKVYDINSETLKTIKPATHFLMPHPYVTKVLSLVPSGDGTGLGGDSGINPLLLMVLLGDGDTGLKDILPMLLLTGGGLGGLTGGEGGGEAMNPLLLMMMMKDGDGGGGLKDILPLLLMTGGNLGNLGGGGGGEGAMNPLLLMMLLKDGDGGGGLKGILPLLLMTGGNLGNLGGGEAGGMNPLLLMMLLKGDDGDGNDLLPLMLLGGLGGGANPLAALAGGKACCGGDAKAGGDAGGDGD